MDGTDLRSSGRCLAGLTLLVFAVAVGGPDAAAETSLASPSLPWLHTLRTSIVDDQDHPVLLRGCNIGSWLMLETWMLDLPDLPDQQAFVDLLTHRFGADEAARLLDVYRDHFIGDRDMEIIRSFGFNVVRVPFDYRLLEDDARPQVLRPEAFRWLDRAVALARARGLYVILDLHGAPGGQSTDHSTGQAGQNRLWRDESLQDRTVWLWTEIARHFADEPCVAGFDLLNEPFGDYETGEHLQPLVHLMDRLYTAVRAVDARHILIVGGPQQGIELYGDPAARGWTNTAFTEHYYPGLHGDHESLATHGRFISRKLRDRQAYLEQVQSAFLVGEFNVVLERLGAPWMTRRYFDEFAERGWAATLWSYKLLSRSGGVGHDNWYLVTNEKPLPPINLDHATVGDVETWLRDVASANPAVDERLRLALTSAVPERLVLPVFPPIRKTAPHHDVLPDWTATDIGDSLPGGEERRNDHAVDLFAGGRDIWNDHDQFRFLAHSAGADWQLTARVMAVEDTSAYAKAGLMWRGGLAPDAPHVLLHVFPDGQVVFGWRDAAGAIMKERKVHLGHLPVWLRLRRDARGLDASWSYDGAAWTSVDRRIVPAGGLAGLAALAHDNNESLTKASFDNIEFTDLKTAQPGEKP